LHVSHRPLAIVSGLTIGDYLLWNWSLNGSHDVLALVSGLTLPPLAAAFLWLIALTGARLVARTRRPGARKAGRASTRQSQSRSATKRPRAAFARGRSGRRAAWLGELRAAKRTLTAERAASSGSAASTSRTRSTAQTPQTAPSQAAQPSPAKRSGSSRKIAA
jgi:hypothetical protein